MLGMPEEKFWDSTPKDVEPYRKMDEMQQQRLDYNMWLMGAYVTNAVGVAVSNALGGKKSHARYLAQPLSAMVAEQDQSDPSDDFNKFAAWAVVYNNNFQKQNGQGE